MASVNGINIVQRSHRRQLFHPAFSPKSPQLMQSNQTVSPTGAAVAIRPRRVALRRMDNRGAGEVGIV
jgi:hypothetical protein